MRQPIGRWFVLTQPLHTLSAHNLTMDSTIISILSPHVTLVRSPSPKFSGITVSFNQRKLEEDVVKKMQPLSFSYSEVEKHIVKSFFCYIPTITVWNGFSWQTKSENIIDVIKEWKGQNKIPLLTKKSFLPQPVYAMTAS